MKRLLLSVFFILAQTGCATTLDIPESFEEKLTRDGQVTYRNERRGSNVLCLTPDKHDFSASWEFALDSTAKRERLREINELDSLNVRDMVKNTAFRWPQPKDSLMLSVFAPLIFENISFENLACLVLQLGNGSPINRIRFKVKEGTRLFLNGVVDPKSLLPLKAVGNTKGFFAQNIEEITLYRDLTMAEKWTLPVLVSAGLAIAVLVFLKLYGTI